MSALSPVARAQLRNPVGRVRNGGITATVFGGTGFLGRYVCAELGAFCVRLWVVHEREVTVEGTLSDSCDGCVQV